MTEDGGTTRRVAGRYRLERRIGRGGAGAVWRAHDERLDRPVAVKQIPIAPDAEASSRDRALREARAAARLRVPTVVQVYDVIEEDGHAYLIMELVDAPNLSTLVRRHGPLEAPKVAAMGLQILDALEAAHRVGILHRDVKPSNVLIDHDTPRLTDFGIARVGDDPALTTTGVVMGTPAYIAPEHARGEEIGPAVDLYGLGATLYYAVEGESPFGAKDSLSTVMAVVTAPPRPMTRAGALTDLLTELLDKKPAARPEPADIRRRLNRVVKSSRPAHARAVTISAPGSGTGEHDAAPAIGDESVPAGTSDVDPDRDAEPTDELRHATPADREEPVDPTVPVGGQQPAGRTARRHDRRPALFAIVVVLALAALISMRTLADGDSGRTDDRQQGSEPAPAAARGTEPAAAAPTPTQSAAAPATSEPSSQPSEAGGDANASRTTEPTPDAGDGVLPATDAEVPRGWVEYAPDHAPYRVSYPPDWEIVSVDGTRTDIRDPNSGTYLRLDWVDERRDPVGAWEAYEPAFASSHSGYERIRITPTRYKGNRAALWEYRYEDGGVRLHAYNLGVNAGDQGFALNMQSHDSDWERAQRLWPYFLSSYEFTGS
jgi:hypothetical protein